MQIYIEIITTTLMKRYIQYLICAVSKVSYYFFATLMLGCGMDRNYFIIQFVLGWKYPCSSAYELKSNFFIPDGENKSRMNPNNPMKHIRSYLVSNRCRIWNQFVPRQLYVNYKSISRHFHVDKVRLVYDYKIRFK